jgi:acetyl-CoA C-acetyltransferase
MGITAENIAELYGISREEQDQLAYESHMRAVKAIDDGIFTQEIVPVEVVQKKQKVVVDTDEHPRRDTSLERLAKLPPVFKKNGTVTAGNASGVNDGASALLVMSEKRAEELGLKPLVRIVSYAAGAIDPAYMGLGPIPAIKKAISRAGLRLDDIGIFDINEAFAAQALAVIRELGLDQSKVNIYGSGISMGHPIGCTGARISTTLIKEMVRSNIEYGLAGRCIGGGMGFPMVFQRA